MNNINKINIFLNIIVRVVFTKEKVFIYKIYIFELL